MQDVNVDTPPSENENYSEEEKKMKKIEQQKLF
jgi:hypothetical protein